MGGASSAPARSYADFLAFGVAIFTLDFQGFNRGFFNELWEEGGGAKYKEKLRKY